MDTEKYKKRIGREVQRCIKEMFKLFEKNNISELTFDNLYAPKLTFYKDSGEVCPQLLETIRLVPETDNEYKRFDLIGNKGWDAYLMKYGGDYFDVACQIGAIYEIVVKSIKELAERPSLFKEN